MLNPENIIEQIREDAPCVYDILHECYFPDIRPYPQEWTDYTWDNLFEANPDIERPSADDLLEELKNYSGDNYDVHFWSGRYAQMIEQNKSSVTPIRVPLTGGDLNDISSWQTFHWTFEGVNLFLFNSDEYPSWDPDSEEYDPDSKIY